jgi:hypothetical protein
MGGVLFSFIKLTTLSETKRGMNGKHEMMCERSGRGLIKGNIQVF